MKIFTRSEIAHIFLGVFLFTLPFILPRFSIAFDVNTILTVVSILFTILVGSFIASATNNYFVMQNLIASSNACLISFYGFAQIIAPSRAAAISESIDRYMIATLDYDLLYFAGATQNELDAIISLVDKITPDPGCSEALMQSIHGVKTELLHTQQGMMTASKIVVGPRHWFILIALAILIGILTLTFREGHLLSTVIVAVLMTALYQVLKLLHEIDTNLFLAQRLAFQNPQPVFTAIGRLPYFPQYAIDRKNVATLPTTYRVGKHNSGSNKITIYVVGEKHKQRKSREA